MSKVVCSVKFHIEWKQKIHPNKALHIPARVVAIDSKGQSVLGSVVASVTAKVLDSEQVAAEFAWQEQPFAILACL